MRKSCSCPREGKRVAIDVDTRIDGDPGKVVQRGTGDRNRLVNGIGTEVSAVADHRRSPVDVDPGHCGSGAIARPIGGGAGSALVRSVGRNQRGQGAGRDSRRDIGTDEAHRHRGIVPTRAVRRRRRAAGDRRRCPIDPYGDRLGSLGVTGVVRGVERHGGNAFGGDDDVRRRA